MTNILDVSTAIALEMLFGSVFVILLVVLAIYDMTRMILPNELNFTLGGVGFLRNITVGNPPLLDGVLGSLLGFVLLLAVARLFRATRDIDGLGMGDLKFMAAAGFWIGWQSIPAALLVATTSALAFFMMRGLVTKSFEPTKRIPFGPFLGLGAFASWSLLFMTTDSGGGPL